MDNKRVFMKTELQVCPYDPVHRVEAGTRFQSHLIECRKNHPGVEERICEFNHTHRVKVPEYSYHLVNCPDNLLHKQLVDVKEFDMKFREKLPKDIPMSVPSSENWENELLSEPMPIPDVTSKPQIKFINTDLLSGKKPRQKKEFRRCLKRGEIKLDFEDDIEKESNNANNKELREPNASPIQAEPIRQPSRLPVSVVTPWHVLKAGRGIFPAHRQPRIAANIFGGNSSNILTSLTINSAGVGRGRAALLAGMGQNFDSENSVQNDLPKPQLAPTIPNTAFEDAEENIQEKENDILKRKKRLEKKLKQIEMLEKKMKNEEADLNEDQIAKLKNKEEIICELQALKIQVSE